MDSPENVTVSSRDRIPQVLILSYLVLTIVVILVGIGLAINWLRAPFIGGFVDQRLFFYNIKLPVNSGGSLMNPEFHAGDQLKVIDGEQVHDASQLQQILMAHSTGQTVSLEVFGQKGQVRKILVELAWFPLASRINFLLIPNLLGVVFLLSAIWVLRFHGSLVSARVFAIFAISMAITIGLLFDFITSHALTTLWMAAICLVGASIIHFTFIFPRTGRLAQRRPWVQYLGYGAAAMLLIYSIIQTVAAAHSDRYPDLLTAMQMEFSFFGLSLLFFLVWTTYRRFASTSPIERSQLQAVLLGGIVSFCPLTIGYLITGFQDRGTFSSLLLVPLAIFPVTIGVSMQQGQRFQSSFIFRRMAIYGLMTILAAVAYALIVSGLSLVLVKIVAPDNPLIIGGMVFLLALALSPARQKVQQMVDIALFKGEKAYQKRIQAFSHDLTNSTDLKSIVEILRQTIRQSMLPAQVHIYIFDPFSDHYVASPDTAGQATSDIRFTAGSPVPLTLSQHRLPLFLSSPESLPAALGPEISRLALLNAQVLIPLPGRKQLAGWLALGKRRSAEAYTDQDLRFLDSLCDQAALAIERAQVVSNMEVRVHQMNVLSRVAQGVNVTLTFDDILELIYAQTNQIIPTRNFQLTITDPQNGDLKYAFYLENDERLFERENKPLTGDSLEKEVIRSRRAILTDDYHKECQKRGIFSPSTRVLSWLSVPLNSGAETIGSMSVGSQDPSVTYTQEQLNFLQAIADQTASAIVKTRLFQESENRSRQLAILNEVTRQLASTLELEPLLQNILQHAVDILDCEAGSLLLVDEQTDELVFQAVAGPVAGDLLGGRLPPGSGIVGKSIKQRQPIIVNNVLQASEWSSTVDNKTGFSTHTLLVAPLQVKDIIIGVIEVINHRDGRPFSPDDLALLSAFASQTAVAIENARLYTQTDQALTARVEELSVMQRIDRELNTSLDIARAMRITLEWAMRQSGAKAGLVGITQSNGLRIMASQGYTDELKAYQDKPLPGGFVAIDEALNTSQPQRNFVEPGFESQALLDGARGQVVIPIRREVNVIGIILLENTLSETCSDEALGFLTRLGDHASIAISNSQLYAAVQDANNAKSEFVSFVAHELKNPMTSIKGYTELLAAGAVGPITAAQANFLSTIRSNIERMNTLISDLNDMSKIEAGRLRLEFKSFFINEVIDDTMRSTRRQVEDKKQEVVTNLQPGLPGVWADRTRITQVMVNLVNNANKYTQSSGQIIIAAEACPNQWDASGPPKVVHVWVKDNGIGINPEDQKKIFQKFFRSEDPKTREVPGTGLGLNITKSLVEMQGGRIWFESQYRNGTTFHFTVPVAE
jgi:signal transduction histidine kinase/putative methionine-R-sulfoxide reductase with GAF domain